MATFRSPQLWLTLLLCLALPACDGILRPSIVGQWQSDALPTTTIEFLSDGTLRQTALLTISKGTYVLLDGGRMKTETEGILWGTSVTTWKYSVSADKLSMTSEGPVGLTLTWTRVKEKKNP